jgi:hypothetical protein
MAQPWGGRVRPGLDAGASAAYIAAPSSRKNSSGQMQARGAAPEPARPRRLPGHGKPSTAARPPQHRARQATDAHQPGGARTPPTVDRKQGARSMRVLCAAPQSPASLSPAVGVADGFPTPCGGGGMAMAKRPIDRDCHTRGIGSNTYLRFPSIPDPLRRHLHTCAVVENLSIKRPIIPCE